MKIKKLKKTKELLSILKEGTAVTLIPYIDNVGFNTYSFGLKLYYNGTKVDRDFGTFKFIKELSKEEIRDTLDEEFYKSLINDFLLGVPADEDTVCLSRVLYQPHKYFEEFSNG
jgi:hypothetical protein